MLADPAAQARLGAAESWSEFAHAAVEVAAQLGVAIASDDLGPLARLAPSGHARFLPPPAPAPAAIPEGWLPVRLGLGPAGLELDWAWFGARGLEAPFLELSIQRALELPLNALCRFRTGGAALAERAARLGRLAPAGLIFHLSRCGSTLVGRMLAAAGATVVSEAAPLDFALQLDRLAPGVSPEDQAGLLRDLAAVLGQRRAGERCAVLKADAWHVTRFELYRRAFPETPWVFLCRNPVEVMVSHARRPSPQMSMQLVDPAALPASALQPEPQQAQVLAAICESALAGLDQGGGMVVDYAELPSAVGARILPHFRLGPTGETRRAMAAAAMRDAKRPGLRFAPDADAKRQAATPAILAACDGRLADAYARLRALSD